MRWQRCVPEMQYKILLKEGGGEISDSSQGQASSLWGSVSPGERTGEHHCVRVSMPSAEGRKGPISVEAMGCLSVRESY